MADRLITARAMQLAERIELKGLERGEKISSNPLAFPAGAGGTVALSDEYDLAPRARAIGQKLKVIRETADTMGDLLSTRTVTVWNGTSSRSLPLRSC